MTINPQSLSAIEDLLAQIAHRQNRVIGSSLESLANSGVHDLTDEYRVITFLNGINEPAFDESRRVIEDR